MYHYVRPNSEIHPYFNNLSVDDFKSQLDYFEKRYGFISQNEYILAIKNQKNIDGIVLTFDDGFKDHFTYVLPELERRGLWGIFYISTGVYHKQKLLGVHRVHYLKGKYGSSVILDELLNIIDDYMLDHDLIDEFDKDIYTHSNYGDDEKQLRRLLNYHIKYKYRDDILDVLMKRFVYDEEKLFEDVYLSKDEIKELGECGNVIGSHTVSHSVLSRLTYQEQFAEIKESFDFIDKIVDQCYKSFCYPYGYDSSYNSNTVDILDSLQIDDACVFDNKVQSDNIEKYKLSRIDCNQFVGV